MTPIRLRYPDGATAVLEVFDGDLPETAPVFLLMPAMGVEARWYTRLGPHLARRGWRLATVDQRGHGRSSVRAARGVDWGFTDLVERDWPVAIDAVARRFPDAPRYLFGHSLGGQLSALFVGSHHGAVDGLVTVASCSVFWASFPWKYKSVVLCGTQISRAVAAVLGYFPGEQLRFGGLESRTVVRDWAQQGLSGRYAPANAPVDYDAGLATTAQSVLMLSLPGDHFYAPAAAVDHLAAKLPPERLTRQHLVAPEIAALGEPHFLWVARPDAVIDAIAAWLPG
jgi:predicted alpha/beta hydrolase